NSIADLRKIAGVGEKTVQKRGLELIRLVDRYRKKQGLEKDKMPQTQLKIPGFEKKTVPETKRTSFEMFKSGLTIAEIAKKRGFTESTIEGHLCFFIEQGRLDVNRLLPLEKQALIREKLKVIGNGNDSLSVIKKQLGDDFSYGEIRMVLALQNYQTQ
ncbi:MAG: helicase, partial [Deltaproteobacteria bacterium]|nr:helicase [Deltaproteobacteria bacterium]